MLKKFLMFTALVIGGVLWATVLTAATLAGALLIPH